MNIKVNSNNYQAPISNSNQNNAVINDPIFKEGNRENIFKDEAEKKVVFNERDFQSHIEEIKSMSNLLNRDLEFNIDRNTDQIFVRIINKSTNEVLRELPSEDLRQLHQKMKEAIDIVGVLIDRKA